MRNREYLNGEWHFMPDYEGRSPEEAINDCIWEERPVVVPSSWRGALWNEHDYQPFNVFEYPAAWNEAASGVLGREFEVQREGEQRVFLIANGILQKSEIYINGCKASESNEGFLPQEIDITSLVRKGGPNEVKVWCGPFDAINTESGRRQLAPSGSWFGNSSRGIWQDVYVEYRNPLFVDHMHIVTSTRKGSYAVKVNVRNEGGALLRGRVRVRIIDGQSVVKEHWTEEYDFAAERAVTVAYEDAWDDAKFWSPESPHLYVLEVELVADGRVVDAAETRFGFREFWIEGNRFYLNGTRINLRTDSWHYQGFVQQNKEYALNWYRACKDMGMNAIRLHAMPYPELYLDAADEAGMLIVDETAIYGSGKAMRADHPDFIENCRIHLRTLVLRDRNHPSVINWSMQNEMRWVDGREGYKAAMKQLVQTMRELDDTRPISFDGDNRLVDPEDMEIVSMHYNIDGTVEGWDKQKPLAFGEHGSFHYIAPQVATAFGGPDVYLSFDACMEAAGAEERHFNEYARREEVSALSPFNMANYMMRSMPERDVRPHWNDLSGPGVKPAVIPRHSLTLNNGYLQDEPAYRPNRAFHTVKESLRKEAVIADEYNVALFGGTQARRSFSIYNDTERAVSASIAYQFSCEGLIVKEGSEQFLHAPGERVSWSVALELPDAGHRAEAVLSLTLIHDETVVHKVEQAYSVFPRSLSDDKFPDRGKTIAYCGDDSGYTFIAGMTERLLRIERCDEQTLDSVDMLVLGARFDGRAEELQPALSAFVARGGFALVLEQTAFAPGELTLSGKSFFSAYMTDSRHPVFAGLGPQDFRFWSEDNVNRSGGGRLARNAFNKPANGEVNVLLECGEGNFGWGGLLWTPLLEYTIGKGKLLLNQLELTDYREQAPQATMLLCNMLKYGIAHEPTGSEAAGALISAESSAERLLKDIGIDFAVVTADSLAGFTSVIADPAVLTPTDIAALKSFVEAGNRLLLLPAAEEQIEALSTLLDAKVDIRREETYQLQPNSDGEAAEWTRGMTVSDLYHYEKVTYSPANKKNEALCVHNLEIEGAAPLWTTVHNPWHDYFVRSLDGEPIKIAIATMNGENAFVPQTYGAVKRAGQGLIVISQIRTDGGNDKIKRIYGRLFANVGIRSKTNLLEDFKASSDFGIPYWMALSYEPHHDYKEEETYFASPDYTLNNLGEGEYGWMQRLEKRDGFVTVPGSKGRTYFLTLFIASELNRNPENRAAGELPDSSIVPDVYITSNCAVKLAVNGQFLLESTSGCDDLRFDDVVLNRGINRLLLVCFGGSEDIRVNLYLKNKYGDEVEGLSYYCTLD